MIATSGTPAAGGEGSDMNILNTGGDPVAEDDL
jgi:hypothetical protein